MNELIDYFVKMGMSPEVAAQLAGKVSISAPQEPPIANGIKLDPNDAVVNLLTSRYGMDPKSAMGYAGSILTQRPQRPQSPPLPPPIGRPTPTRSEPALSAPSDIAAQRSSRREQQQFNRDSMAMTMNGKKNPWSLAAMKEDYAKHVAEGKAYEDRWNKGHSDNPMIHKTGTIKLTKDYRGD